MPSSDGFGKNCKLCGGRGATATETNQESLTQLKFANGQKQEQHLQTTRERPILRLIRTISSL
jgi:hypothetical protein